MGAAPRQQAAAASGLSASQLESARKQSVPLNPSHLEPVEQLVRQVCGGRRRALPAHHDQRLDSRLDAARAAVAAQLRQARNELRCVKSRAREAGVRRCCGTAGGQQQARATHAGDTAPTLNQHLQPSSPPPAPPAWQRGSEPACGARRPRARGRRTRRAAGRRPQTAPPPHPGSDPAARAPPPPRPPPGAGLQAAGGRVEGEGRRRGSSM